VVPLPLLEVTTPFFTDVVVFLIYPCCTQIEFDQEVPLPPNEVSAPLRPNVVAASIC
jgi:hypothetical protein